MGQAQVTHDGHEDAHAGCDEVPQGGGLGIHATCAETLAAEWRGCWSDWLPVGGGANDSCPTSHHVLLRFHFLASAAMLSDKLRNLWRTLAQAFVSLTLPYLSFC